MLGILKDIASPIVAAIGLTFCAVTVYQSLHPLFWHLFGRPLSRQSSLSDT